MLHRSREEKNALNDRKKVYSLDTRHLSSSLCVPPLIRKFIASWGGRFGVLVRFWMTRWKFWRARPRSFKKARSYACESSRVNEKNKFLNIGIFNFFFQTKQTRKWRLTIYKNRKQCQRSKLKKYYGNMCEINLEFSHCSRSAWP